MTRQEIRIGNLIKQGEIDCIHPQCVEVITEIKSRKFIDFYEAETIPLTEEWLLNFGFKRKASRIELKVTELIDFASSLVWNNDVLVYYTDEWIGIKVSTVHELQNLYFTLTGKELEMKQK